MLGSETAPSTQVSDAFSLGHAFNTFSKELTPKVTYSSADIPLLIILDLNVAYQPRETSERREAPSSVLVGYTRSGLLEEATEAAEYYMDFFVANQLDDK